MSRVLPLARQLRGYSAHSLRGDLVAAATVVATLVPQGLAYGAVAGLRPVAGLYTAVGAAVLFSLVTSTRRIAVGPSATLAVLTFEAVHGPAGGDPGRAAALAACLSVMAGVLYLVAALVRLQGMADFLSRPVTLGYLAGSAVVILAGQLGPLIGVHTTGAGPVEKIWFVLTHLRQAHPLTAMVGLGAVVLLILIKRLAPRLPASLVVLAGSVVVSATTGLAHRGVAVVGSTEGGLPTATVPTVTAHEVWALLPAAAAVALIGFVETVAATREVEGTGEEVRPPAREAAALGAASVASGLLGGFAPMASSTRSMSARAAGATTQLFQIGSALIVVIVLATGGHRRQLSNGTAPPVGRNTNAPGIRFSGFASG